MIQTQPLAARMRPQHLSEVIGQPHLLTEGKPLYQALVQKEVHSMILWGPPGTGKTTLAKLLAANAEAAVESISAVLAGVKEIRAVVAKAQDRLSALNQRTVLFVDEVHRFNKAQQDAFLPFVEDGTITLIGATTENPSFELNNALLSRARVYVLKRLDESAIQKILEQAIKDPTRGLGARTLVCPPELLKQLAHCADGDARQALNLLEILADFAQREGDQEIIPESALKEVLTTGVRRFDKRGEYFYDQISALHKAIRGSSPDAALYWLSRMLEAGCDPLYVARRLVRLASEDIGNADPRALTLTLNAWEVYERLGSPEGELAIAHAVTYLACAPKSNAVYKAFNEAWRDAKNSGTQEVPMHLRNAPTKLMKNLGYGKNYRYAHDEAEAFAAGETYFPESMGERVYYHPAPRGLEIKISEKLSRLRSKGS